MTAVPAFTAERASSVVLGSCSASVPRYHQVGRSRPEAGLEPVTQPRHVPGLGGEFRQRRGRGRAESWDARHVSVPARAPALLPAAWMSGRGSASSRRA